MRCSSSSRSAPMARGARLLSRITRKSWDVLGLHEGLNVFARVKAVKLR